MKISKYTEGRYSMKRKLISALLLATMTMGLLAGCGQKEEVPAVEENVTEEATEETTEETSREKTTVKFYGKCIEYSSGPMMTDALEKKLADVYNIESIQIDWANQDKVIRTGIASGEPCDIYNYTPQLTLANMADMALDLTPYLEADPEWKAQFNAGDLAAGTTVDGKIVNIPWELNFSVILANKAALEEVIGTIPESWTYIEFLDACQKIKDAGFWPFANGTDNNRADWLFRNAMLSEVVTAGTVEEYVSGELSYEGEETKRALENVKSLYDNEFMYPGEGAVTSKNDEVKAAFYQGKLLMMPEIAAGAKATASEAEFEVVAIPWPSSNTEAAILGGLNGFFIPANSANPDAAVEVLKAYTAADIQAIHAAEGFIPANVNVEVEDEFVKTVAAQSSALNTNEPFTTAINDYRVNQLMADLILNGGVETAVAGLEAARAAE